jgi:hypothetical protein
MEDPNRKWNILLQNKIPSWYFKDKLLMLSGYLIWKMTLFFFVFEKLEVKELQFFEKNGKK